MTELHYTDRTATDISTVWAVLTDHANMSSWLSRTWRSRLVRPGDSTPDGVGAVRAVLTLGGPVREEIDEFDVPHHLGYRMVFGAPVLTHYRGDVKLATDRAGTVIDWTFTFDPRPSWLSPLVTWIVHTATSSCARDLGRASERLNM